MFEHTVLFYDRVLTKQERDLIEKREKALYDKSLELDPEYGKGSQSEQDIDYTLLTQAKLDQIFEADPSLRYPHSFDQKQLEALSEEEKQAHIKNKFLEVVAFNMDQTCALCL